MGAASHPLRFALSIHARYACRSSGACCSSGWPLDAALLKQAVRQADLLLLHLADPLTPARRLSAGEAAVR